jgi:RNA polymerase sigma-70 factor (ECF subfamily)
MASPVIPLFPPPRPVAPGRRVGPASEWDDSELLQGVRAQQPAALSVFYERHAARVERWLWRIIGYDRELEDIHQEVFVRAFRSISTLESPEALLGWLHTITIFTARTALKRRTRRSWLLFFEPELVPEPEATRPEGGSSDALEAAFRILRAMSVDDRIAFSLRYLEGLELTEIATSTSVSLATVKRRLARARERFMRRASQDPALQNWVSDEPHGFAEDDDEEGP